MTSKLREQIIDILQGEQRIFNNTPYSDSASKEIVFGKRADAILLAIKEELPKRDDSGLDAAYNGGADKNDHHAYGRNAYRRDVIEILDQAKTKEGTK